MSDSEKKPAATRRSRARSARTGRGRKPGMSRIFIGAIALVVLGATFMFWPTGGGDSSGIGERRTVVTAGDSQLAATPAAPRSGDVDLEEEIAPLVAEGAEAPARRQDPPATQPEPQRTDTGSRPDDDAPATVAPAAGEAPLSDGDHVIQVAAFGSRENADRFVARLASQGHRAHIVETTRSDGRPLYKIRIGYFAGRASADAYLDANRQVLGDALVIKR